jgi:negative regulator of flagellin synthesis FlgM
MKITHNKVGQNLNLTDAGKTEKASDKLKSSEVKNQQTVGIKPEGSESSKVELSSRAKDIQNIKNLALNSSPDVDPAKVDRFQKLIDSGKYKVDAKAIANKLVDEQLFSTEQSSNE